MAGHNQVSKSPPGEYSNLLTPGRISIRARRDSLEDDEGSIKWNTLSDRGTSAEEDDDDDYEYDLKATPQISNVALAAALNNASRVTSPMKGPAALAAATRAATRFPLRSVTANQRQGVTFTYAAKSAPSTPRVEGTRKHPIVQQVSRGHLQFTRSSNDTKSNPRRPRSIKFTNKSRSKTTKASHPSAQHHQFFRSRRKSNGPTSTHIKFNNKRSQSQKTSSWSRSPAYGNSVSFPPTPRTRGGQTPHGTRNGQSRRSSLGGLGTPSVGIRYSK